MGRDTWHRCPAEMEWIFIFFRWFVDEGRDTKRFLSSKDFLIESIRLQHSRQRRSERTDGISLVKISEDRSPFLRRKETKMNDQGDGWISFANEKHSHRWYLLTFVCHMSHQQEWKIDATTNQCRVSNIVHRSSREATIRSPSTSVQHQHWIGRVDWKTNSKSNHNGTRVRNNCSIIRSMTMTLLLLIGQHWNSSTHDDRRRNVHPGYSIDQKEVNVNDRHCWSAFSRETSKTLDEGKWSRRIDKVDSSIEEKERDVSLSESIEEGDGGTSMHVRSSPSLFEVLMFLERDSNEKKQLEEDSLPDCRWRWSRTIDISSDQIRVDDRCLHIFLFFSRRKKSFWPKIWQRWGWWADLIKWKWRERYGTLLSLNQWCEERNKLEEFTPPLLHRRLGRISPWTRIFHMRKNLLFFFFFSFVRKCQKRREEMERSADWQRFVGQISMNCFSDVLIPDRNRILQNRDTQKDKECSWKEFWAWRRSPLSWLAKICRIANEERIFFPRREIHLRWISLVVYFSIVLLITILLCGIQLVDHLQSIWIHLFVAVRVNHDSYEENI